MTVVRDAILHKSEMFLPGSTLFAGFSGALLSLDLLALNLRDKGAPILGSSVAAGGEDGFWYGRPVRVWHATSFCWEEVAMEGDKGGIIA